MSQNIPEVRRFELNPNKQDVRNDIVCQIMKFAAASKAGSLLTFSLPGELCLFEQTLAERCRAAGVNLSMLCAERNRKIHRQARLNLPGEGEVRLAKMEDTIYETIFSGVNHRKFNVIWADFCGAPKNKDIGKWAEYVKLVLASPGIFYFTAWIFGRGIGRQGVVNLIRHGQAALAARGEPEDQPVTIQMVRDELNKAFVAKLCQEGVRVRKVYDVIYPGGGTRHTTMITMGFMKGVRAGDPRMPKPIVEDRQVELRKVSSLPERIRKKEGVETRDIVFALIRKKASTETIMRQTGLSQHAVGAFKAHWGVKEAKRQPWLRKMRSDIQVPARSLREGY